MTISNKLSYLNDTKTLLRESINQAGGSITEETPFREYPSWVNYVVWLNSGGLETLFSEGEAGVLWSSLPYFVDTAGTTEATWGDPVGLVKDASPTRADFTQPTVTARPILGRVPRGGRRNLLRNTEEFASWGVAGAGTEKTDVFELEGVQYQRFSTSGDTAFSAFSCFGSVSGLVAVVPGRYIKSFRYIPGDAPAFWDRTPNTAGNSLEAKFNISGGAVSFAGFSGSWTGISGVTASASAVGDGSWDINIVYNVTSSMNVTAGTISLLLGVAGAYGDAGAFGNLQFEMVATGVSVHSHYQRVGSTVYNITESGVPDVYYLDFDGTDDLISTTLPAIENGTVVIAGTNGIWIDDDYNFDGGTFSIGPTSYTNGPDGILTAIGEPIVGGSLVINRQLSQLERDLVIQEMKERGAPGVFELGPEIINDPEYDDPAAWVTAGAQPPIVSDGVVRFEWDGIGQYPQIYQDGGLPVGEPCLYEVEVESITVGALAVYAGIGSSTPWTSIDTAGITKTILTRPASSSNRAGRLARDSGAVQATVSRISVRKLELIP